MSKSRAFTILELLITVGVISVLSGIGLAVAASAKVGAKTSACVSNVSQLLKATEMYSADHDDRFVPTWQNIWPVEVPSTQPTWTTLILPYVRASLHCPVAPSQKRTLSSSYALNAELMRAVDWSRYKFEPKNSSEVAYPSTTITVCDSPTNIFALLDIFVTGWHSFGSYSDLDLSTFVESEKVGTRHGGNIVVGLADGHVKTIDYRRISRTNNGISLSFATSEPRNGLLDP